MLAVVINLLAAGGIGIPTVALALWSMLAIGLNLRDDRPCGRLREYESRVPPFVLAVAWAALLGTFVGLVSPFWWSERFIAEADEARSAIARPISIAPTRLISRPIEADGYYVRPWRELAHLHFAGPAQKARPRSMTSSRAGAGRRFPILYQMAAAPPRNPNAWGIHSERAAAIHQMLGLIGSKLEPVEVIRLRGEIVKSTRTRHAAQSDQCRAARPAGPRERRDQHVSRRRHEANEACASIGSHRISTGSYRRRSANVSSPSIPTWQENAAKMPVHGQTVNAL